MKVLIIGNTSGIGEGIHKLLPSAIGVSRKAGINIDKIETIQNLSCEGFEAIVLNAYSDFTSQLKSLYAIVENESFNRNTMIVIMSSINAFNENPSDINRSKYAVEKAALNKASRDLNKLGYNIATLCPGYTDTKWNNGKDVPKMCIEFVANKVVSVINDYIKYGVLVSEMVFEKPKDQL